MTRTPYVFVACRDWRRTRNLPDPLPRHQPCNREGRFTPTFLPANDSVLVNAAANDCEGADQRRLVRNVGACDVGAVEVGASLIDALLANDFEL
jgi:hypothetical protein